MRAISHEQFRKTHWLIHKRRDFAAKCCPLWYRGLIPQDLIEQPDPPISEPVFVQAGGGAERRRMPRGAFRALRADGDYVRSR